MVSFILKMEKGVDMGILFTFNNNHYIEKLISLRYMGVPAYVYYINKLVRQNNKLYSSVILNAGLLHASNFINHINENVDVIIDKLQGFDIEKIINDGLLKNIISDGMLLTIVSDKIVNGQIDYFNYSRNFFDDIYNNYTHRT